jgi:DNA-directed RNA polymerase subunit M/transcription elongation factor TFIIS
MSKQDEMRCRQCGSRDILRVELRLQDDPIVFITCPTCEARWWERDGSDVSRSAVLKGFARR